VKLVVGGLTVAWLVVSASLVAACVVLLAQLT
jgi:hypothetical protein